MHVENTLRKSKSVPRVHSGDGDLGYGPIAGARAKFIEPAVVERAKALKETVDESFALI